MGEGGKQELKCTCGKRHYQGKREGLRKHLRWDPELGAQPGEDSQRVRRATVGVTGKQERAGPRDRRTGARGGSKDRELWRGGGTEGSPDGGGTRAGGVRGCRSSVWNMLSMGPTDSWA